MVSVRVVVSVRVRCDECKGELCGCQDNPHSYPQPTSMLPTGPITRGQSDGDDVGELVQPEFRVGESDECKCARVLMSGWVNCDECEGEL